MDYLDLVEEYNEERPISQFEKVKILASRARDIYEGKTCKIKGLEGRKATTMAQFEYLTGKIEPQISEHAEEEEDFDDDMDDDDMDDDDDE